MTGHERPAFDSTGIPHRCRYGCKHSLFFSQGIQNVKSREDLVMNEEQLKAADPFSAAPFHPKTKRE